MPETFTPPKTSTPKGITPVKEYTAPPKEVLERADFTMDPSIIKNDDAQRVTLETKDGEVKPLTVEPVKVVEEPKVSSVLKAPTGKELKAEEKPKGDTLKINLPNKDKVQRDYTGYSQDEVSHFKQMSDGAYKYVTEVLKQKKELEKNKDGMFYQHPEAYTLTPEYKQTVASINGAWTEGQYWQQALNDCKEGKSVKQFMGFNPDGSPKLGEEVPASGIVEEQIRANMMKCNSVAEQQKQNLMQRSNTFQQKVQQDLQMVQQERSTRFAWVADPKLLDHTLSIEGVGERSIKDIRQDVINLFPPYLRSNPATEVAADLMVALRIQHAELVDAKSNQQIAEIKQQEAQRAEPSSVIKPKPKADMIHGVSEFSLAGIPQ